MCAIKTIVTIAAHSLVAVFVIHYATDTDQGGHQSESSDTHCWFFTS
jgi:hypothetical protein